MEPLRALLQALLPALQRSLPGNVSRALWLQSIPTTRSVMTSLTRLEAAIAEAEQHAATAPSPTARAAWQAEAAARRAERQALGALLPGCHERDLLQAQRPADCWCLGLGGGGIPTLTDDGQAIYAWTRWCTCPEAQALRARVEADAAAAAAREAAEAAAAAQRATAERLAAAGIPAALAHCTLASYPVARPQVLAALARFATPQAWPLEASGSVAAGTWLQRRRCAGALRSVWLWGPPGRGKSGLAAAALRAWIEAGGAGRFCTAGDYLERLRQRMADHGVAAEREALRRTPLLVLDDLGTERVTDWVRAELFALLHYRLEEERLPTLITSNFPPAAALARLGSETEAVMAERLTSRVLGACDVVAVRGGPDLRRAAAAVQEGVA